jgi:hypothetical protein
MRTSPDIPRISHFLREKLISLNTPLRLRFFTSKTVFPASHYFGRYTREPNRDFQRFPISIGGHFGKTMRPVSPYNLTLKSPSSTNAVQNLHQRVA